MKKLIFLWLISNSLFLTSGLLFDFSQNNIAKDINFLVYKGTANETSISKVKLNENPVESLMELMNFSSGIVFYGPGFRQEANDKTTVAIMKAYLDKKFNIIQLDWSKLSFGLYPIVVYKLEKIAEVFAKPINNFLKHPKVTQPFYLIGHSQGAHLISLIARILYKPPDLAVGLDPAGPLYYLTNDRFRFGIAKQVISLHTDSGFYGTLLRDADLAIIVNGGYRLQPGCKFSLAILTEEELCSHQRSVAYWIRIINDPKLSEIVAESLKKRTRKLYLSIGG